MLRVTTSPKALRAIRGSSFKLWESKEKLTGWNTLPAVRKTKGTEKLQRRAGPSPLEVGGRGRGKGQTQPQRRHLPTHGKQAPGSYLKIS